MKMCINKSYISLMYVNETLKSITMFHHTNTDEENTKMSCLVELV